MSIENKLWDIQEKLATLCYDNHLQVNFKRADYPITFEIKPIYEHAAQVEIAEVEGANTMKTDPDASINMIFEDELIIRITKDFTIDDDILNKLKALAKKIHYLFLQLYFKNVMQGEQWNAKNSDNDTPPPTA